MCTDRNPVPENPEAYILPACIQRLNTAVNYRHLDRLDRSWVAARPSTLGLLIKPTIEHSANNTLFWGQNAGLRPI
jgi:hypothetical protein